MGTIELSGLEEVMRVNLHPARQLAQALLPGMAARGQWIMVNAVAPGPTETELFRANNPPGSEGERRYLPAVPMQHFGSPHEIAAAVAFLLSDEAGFIAGQTIHVDGGASIGKAAF